MHLLLEVQTVNVLPVELDNPKTQNAASPHRTTITYTIDHLTRAGAINEALEDARSGTSALESLPAIVGTLADQVSNAAEMASGAQQIEVVWDPLLSKVEAFVKVVDKIAEVRSGTLSRSDPRLHQYLKIHPYASMAWSVLSAIPKVRGCLPSFALAD